MGKIQLAVVAGARPNFMKIAPLLRALENDSRVTTTLVHTGQHYDANLSGIFFRELSIKEPDVHLGIGGGSHGEQTARILASVEKVLQNGPAPGELFHGLIVVGDVNSTMAAALAASKLAIPVAHVEAGLRSFDRTMPEEINRVVTDSISEVLLVSEPAGVDNLRREGHADEQIHLVGNLMIDTLRQHVPQARKLSTLTELGLKPSGFLVLTLHRPSNVDCAKTLSGFVEVLIEIAELTPVVFPVHPRTMSRLDAFGLSGRLKNIRGFRILEPLGYLDFLCLTSQARAVITDSGGLQEEATALGIPCLTLRANTERPITVELGTSTLIGSDAHLLHEMLEQVFKGTYKQGKCPELWDGRAAGRAARILIERL